MAMMQECQDPLKALLKVFSFSPNGPAEDRVNLKNALCKTAHLTALLCSYLNYCWSEKNFLLACQIWSTAPVTEAPLSDSSILSQRPLMPVEQPFEFTGLWIKPSQLSDNSRYVKNPPCL